MPRYVYEPSAALVEMMQRDADKFGEESVWRRGPPCTWPGRAGRAAGAAEDSAARLASRATRAGRGRSGLNTVVGPLGDADGLATKVEAVQGVDRPELVRRSWATPTSEVRTIQPERIAVDYAHDGRQLGEVVALLRHGDDSIAWRM